ncbi:hypothetical protein CCAX7_30460 [Capsulimonas corticalis]|uniref:Activator of Hsp90 ATPase homologue 1/2-like C-terminal domain-containing protein n=1 Tax=Capsulimonas corticalis TaxID=2219043 RepID=A0A402CSS2_9BACT|nr:SRPBCC domain-containing protein [Capsulimonas corticalis]BDI30995.1 hypothetical protein CCAX7_30460 [Capsulimonas corticalis]
MVAQDYLCRIEAPVSAAEAFEKISRVSEWWAKNFSGSARELGDTFQVRFGGTFVDFEITEAEPSKKIVWQVVNCNLNWLSDKTEWSDTSVLWELSEGNGVTGVTMVHRGLVPGMECYEECNQGWNFFVSESLQQFLSVGQGLPKGDGGHNE